MAKVHGQIDDRAARIRETASWLGATPLDHLHQPIIVGPGPEEVELDVVAQTLETIRAASGQQVATRVTEMHGPNVQAIKEALGAEEMAYAVFDYDQMHSQQL